MPKSECPHSYDKDRCLQKLFLSRTFVKMWEAVIEFNLIKESVCICVECGQMFRAAARIDEHIAKAGHCIYFVPSRYSIYCRKCHKYSKAPEEFVMYALLSTPIPRKKLLHSGFKNIGNNCYSSAVLIALSHCKALLSAASISKIPLCRIFAAAATQSRDFNLYIHDLMPEFCPMEQQDASEFMYFMLTEFIKDPTIAEMFDGKMETHLNCPNCGDTCMSLTEFLVFNVVLSAKTWEGASHPAKLKPRGYGGKRKWDCRVEKGASFNNALVSAFQHGITTSIDLETCLQSTFLASVEKCHTCGCEDASSYSFLTSLPEIMIIQNERFGERWFGVGKMHHHVSFPTDHVTFDDYVPENIHVSGCEYRLNAIITHTGLITVGHFMCIARDEGVWREYNDETVTVLTDEEVAGVQAYLLFYSKVPSQGIQEALSILKELDIPQGPVNTLMSFSDPAKLLGRISTDLDEALYDQLNSEIGGSCLRSRTIDDIRNEFIEAWRDCKTMVKVTKESADEIWEFVKGRDKLPVIRLQEDGFSVPEVSLKINCI